MGDFVDEIRQFFVLYGTYIGIFFIIASLVALLGERIYTYKKELLEHTKDKQQELVKNGIQGFENPMQATRSLFTSTIPDAALTNQEQYLVNLQPLTANVAGYIGPMERGFFDPDTYLDTAIDAGIRAFILPISVYNDPNLVPPDWPGSNKPAVLFRKGGENNKVVQSANGMQIKAFLNSLLIRMQKNNNQADEPILIVLKEQKDAVPDSVEDEEKYVKLMDDMGAELASVSGLDEYRLKILGSLGSATGGGNDQAILMDVPLSQLKNKILFFTDFDLSILNKTKYSKSRVTPSLAEFINFRMQPLGASGSGSSPQPNIVSSSSKVTAVRTLSSDAIPGSKINWADQTRTNFLIASDDSPYAVQTKETVQAALKAGLQMIPIPFYYVKGSEQKALWDLWKGGAYLVKEKDARFTKPEKIQPAPANPAFVTQVSSNTPPGGVTILSNK